MEIRVKMQPSDDPIRDRVLNKRLTFWEHILKFFYSKQEWEAYLLEKIEKKRAKGKFFTIKFNSF